MMEPLDTPEGILYDMRRNIASQLHDGELIRLMLHLRNCLTSLRENGTKIFDLQSKFPMLDEAGGEEILEIALLETKNALRPFEDEWNDRRKN